MEQVRKVDLLKSLSDELVADGLITKDQLQKAIGKQTIGETWADALIRENILSEEEWLAYLEKHGVGIVNPSDTLIDPEMKSIIPEKIARQYRFVPLYELDGKLTIATPDPDNIPAMDYLRIRLKKETFVLYCTQSKLEEAWEKIYSPEESVVDYLNESLMGFEEEDLDAGPGAEAQIDDHIELKELQSLVAEAPVIRMVNMVLAQSIARGSSDIHISPQENELIIRHRVDGILHVLTKLPKKLERVLLSRLKIMAGMDIAEHRVPQDGRFKVKLKGKHVDIRASIYPTQFGENMVMRILHRESAMVKLDDLGFLETTLNKWRFLLNTSGKIVLVTGPTGSGKTTTLYASLNEINDTKVNIMTIEDPIEYNLPLIRQAQVNSKIGMTFANGLRSILRQDPDIIMVGEIRDEETARIATQAALTGHLVFSTLHTNSAIGAISRLIDMGIEPFLVASSVIGVLGQRLVRLICKECKEKYDVPMDVRERFKRENLDMITKAFVGKGCDACHGTGYSGRMVLTELFEITAPIRDLIAQQAGEEKMFEIARQNGMRRLRQDGVAKVLAGLTTISEVFRVTPEE